MKHLYTIISMIIAILAMSFTPLKLNAQKLELNAGLEGMHSFNYPDKYWGAGVGLQADYWVKSSLGLGLYAAASYFHDLKKYSGHTAAGAYSLIPVLGVVRYPIPILKNLYGQDMFGYSFTSSNVIHINDRQSKMGGFTYYFALGYVVKNKWDFSMKVGRTRLAKKNDPVNINEHNFGIKLAYIFYSKHK